VNEELADTDDVEDEQGETDWDKEVPSDDRLSDEAKKELEKEKDQ
jgi:hypothetical protein